MTVLTAAISKNVPPQLPLLTENSPGPALKWAGGKRWLVPMLRTIWITNSQPRTRLVEPFAGGLAVALGLSPMRALLNDVNPHLINFYRWVKRSPVFDIHYANDQLSFSRARRRFNVLVSDPSGRRSKEAAATFYYLNRTCFNGLCRFNASGEFNVPFGRYKSPGILRDFSALSKVMATWELKSRDFARLTLEPRDFVYADPPYDVEFTAYSKGGFRWDEQVRLAEWLANHPGPVIASNQATDRIVKLYRQLKFKISFVDAPRRISCNGDRTPAREMIAMRNILR